MRYEPAAHADSARSPAGTSASLMYTWPTSSMKSRTGHADYRSDEESGRMLLGHRWACRAVFRSLVRQVYGLANG